MASVARPLQLPPLSARAFLVAWAIFWLLLTTVSLQDHWRRGGSPAWLPLFWEGTSFVVSSAVIGLLWRQIMRNDKHLHDPWRWMRWPLLALPPVALAFVSLLYALRHGLHALAGLTYRHADWVTVYRYESLKFTLFYGLFAAMFFAIRSHAALNAQRLQAEHSARLANEARMLQLTQALEPHFLFNALNTIAATVHEDANRADELITRLAAILRSATDLARRPTVRLADEIALLEHYADIMSMRFGDRVAVTFDLEPGCRQCTVPTLCLQPLLENAYRHGVERIAGPVAIQVRARLRDGQRLILEVEQDRGALKGVPMTAVPSANAGQGLENLRNRLHLAYGDQALLSLVATEAGGVIARLDLPCAC